MAPGERPGDPADAPEHGRVRITSPLTVASTHVQRSVRQEIDEETGVGEVYIRSLVRSQLRSALGVVALLAVTIGAMPLAFTLVDGLADVRLGPVPLPWLVLGVLVYPLLLLIGWVYVRRAERAEADFTALVQPDAADRGDPAGVPGLHHPVRGRPGEDPAGAPGLHHPVRGRPGEDPAGAPGSGRQGEDPAGVPGSGRQGKEQ